MKEMIEKKINQQQFDYKRIAEGYAKDRPFLHGHVMEMVRAKMQLTQNYGNGIDIGCGAGLSTKALRMICNNVTGTDISPEMVKAASMLYREEEGYHFRTCKAEEIEAEAGSVDIVTAAGVINWVDETRFLPLLQCILKEKGLFLIYDFWITDQMEESPAQNEAYTAWWHEAYLPNFPKPARKEQKWSDGLVKEYGFQMYAQEEYTTALEMDRDFFVRFMLLQSNVIAQVEEQGKDLEAVRTWFQESLSKFWDKEIKKLVFQGYNWYILKI